VTTDNEDQVQQEVEGGAEAVVPAAAPTTRPAMPFQPRGPRTYGRSGPGGEGGEGGPSDGPSGRPPMRKPRRGIGKDRFAPRRKVCQFCADKIRVVDYKDFQRLRRYLSDRGKIEPRRKTGTCARHQRSLTIAIKRGRYMALLPYVASQAR